MAANNFENTYRRNLIYVFEIQDAAHQGKLKVGKASIGIDTPSDQLCPDCYNQQVSKENQENGLPKLEGSEKQINWAEKIRKQNISKINGFIQDRRNTLKSWEMKRDESLAEGKEPDHRLLEGIMGCKMEVRSLEEILDKYKAETSAKVIIESRDDYRYEQDMLQRFINEHQWTTMQEAMEYFNLID